MDNNTETGRETGVADTFSREEILFVLLAGASSGFVVGFLLGYILATVW